MKRFCGVLAGVLLVALAAWRFAPEFEFKAPEPQKSRTVAEFIREFDESETKIQRGNTMGNIIMSPSGYTGANPVTFVQQATLIENRGCWRSTTMDLNLYSIDGGIRWIIESDMGPYPNYIANGTAAKPPAIGWTQAVPSDQPYPTLSGDVDMPSSVKRYAGDRLVGLSTDTKPTNIADGAEFLETNTSARYVKSGGIWVPTTLETMCIAISDETATITTGVAKLTFRMPFAMKLTTLPRAGLNVASTSGIPTFDINEGGVSILSTKLTIDANEKTSVTAATPAVISDPNLADDAEISFDVDVAGTNARGAKIWLIGVRA